MDRVGRGGGSLFASTGAGTGCGRDVGAAASGSHVAKVEKIALKTVVTPHHLFNSTFILIQTTHALCVDEIVETSSFPLPLSLCIRPRESSESHCSNKGIVSLISIFLSCPKTEFYAVLRFHSSCPLLFKFLFRRDATSRTSDGRRRHFFYLSNA